MRGQLARDHPHRPGVPRRARVGPEPFGAVVARARAACRRPSGAPAPPRWLRSSAAWPRPTDRRSGTSPTPTSCSTSAAGRSSAGSPRSAPRAPTTSCARRCDRSCSTCRPRPRSTTSSPGSRELHAAYRDDYRAYYERHADADSPPMRGADPGHRARARRRHVLLRRQQADGPRRRRVLRQRHQRDARRRVGVDLRADPGGGEVPHRVLGARGGQAAAAADSRSPLSDARRLRHGRRLGHRPRHRPPPRRRGRVRRRRRPRRRVRGERVAARDRRSRRRRAGHGRRDRRRAGRRRARRGACWPSAASTSSSTTPGCRSRSRCSRPPRTTGTSSTT